MPDQKAERHWTLDRRIPLAFILALMVQAGGIVWWAQSVSKDVASSAQRIDRIESQRVSERLAALESQMTDSRSSLLRIESKLDRLIESKGSR